MDKNELELEKAKTFFVLAQILIILAGFFFAMSGIALTNAQNSINQLSDMNSNSISTINFVISNFDKIQNFNLSEDYVNLTRSLIDSSYPLPILTKTNSSIAMSSFLLGIFFFLSSITSFIVGRRRIFKINLRY